MVSRQPGCLLRHANGRSAKRALAMGLATCRGGTESIGRDPKRGKLELLELAHSYILLHACSVTVCIQRYSDRAITSQPSSRQRLLGFDST